MDEPTFAQRFEADATSSFGPKLQDFVDHYDDAGIVLKTNVGVINPSTQHEEPESNNATRAKEALKRMKK
jgi:hypothetical protein